MENEFYQFALGVFNKMYSKLTKNSQKDSPNKQQMFHYQKVKWGVKSVISWDITIVKNESCYLLI